MNWILIFAFYAGAASKYDSIALQTATFQNKETCVKAGEAFKNEFTTLYKSVKYICVPSSMDNKV